MDVNAVEIDLDVIRVTPNEASVTDVPECPESNSVIHVLRSTLRQCNT